MSSIRFVMIGGFLGAGKTTSIGRLAQAYQQRGQKVGIVTNDQATDLVDTNMLRSQGFDVGEVAGACFCCNFNELTSTIGKLSADQKPDVVLAEPVGSCTDLVATVIQPILRLYGEKFSVAPYGVILKPAHGQKILKGDPRAGFSPKAAYIFKKQLEEADFLILNRIDELKPAEVDELSKLLEKECPDRPILRMSARTGQGFDGLLEMLDQKGLFGRRILDLDYDIYAEGEAELGWLNSSLRVESKSAFELDKLLTGIVDRLRTVLQGADAETAHLKVIGLAEGAYGVANLISRDTPTTLSLPSHFKTTQADVVVNARVATDPDDLKKHVEQAVRDVCQHMGCSVEFRQTQSFRPGRPVPTHRFAEPVQV
jgi:Ni2+-binding GTPase involved in maturation of urease and hydrogenase